MAATPRGPVPRLSLTVAEACEALGVSWDFWREQVAPEVRIVRRGRRKLVPVAELERWLNEHAEATLPDATGRGSPVTGNSPAPHAGSRGARASRVSPQVAPPSSAPLLPKVDEHGRSNGRG